MGIINVKLICEINQFQCSSKTLKFNLYIIAFEYQALHRFPEHKQNVLSSLVTQPWSGLVRPIFWNASEIVLEAHDFIVLFGPVTVAQYFALRSFPDGSLYAQSSSLTTFSLCEW